MKAKYIVVSPVTRRILDIVRILIGLYLYFELVAGRPLPYVAEGSFLAGCIFIIGLLFMSLSPDQDSVKEAVSLGRVLAAVLLTVIVPAILLKFLHASHMNPRVVTVVIIGITSTLNFLIYNVYDKGRSMAWYVDTRLQNTWPSIITVNAMPELTRGACYIRTVEISYTKAPSRKKAIIDQTQQFISDELLREFWRA